MGKVDQGVFTHWMLAHHFRNPLSYIGFGGHGKQVRDLLHVEDLVDLVERAAARPGGLGRAHRERRRRPRVQPLAAGDDRDLPAADRQRGADRSRCRRPAPGTSRCTSPTARGSSASTSGDPRRSAEQVLADIHDWIAADEARIAAALEIEPQRGEGSRQRMPVAIITGSGGLIGSEAVDHFVARGLRRRRDRERHAGQLLRPRGLDLARHRAADRGLPRRVPLGERRHPRRRGGRADLPPSTPARSSSSSTPPPSPRTTGPRASRRPTSASTPTAPSTCSRRRAPTAPTRPSSSARPTRSTATRRTGCRSQSLEKRLELPEDHPYYKGIDTSMSIDSSTHSLFGVSKAAADLLVQEYGRYFDMPTVAFRGGCLTGPQHAGAKLHGFLAYLMKCIVTGTPYTVFGYEGKQVRDNIHSADLIAAFDAFRKAPRAGGRLQHRRRPLQQLLDAGGDRRLRADRRPRAAVGDGRGAADRRPPLVDLRPRAVRGRLPRLEAALRDRGDPRRRCTSRTSSAGWSTA